MKSEVVESALGGRPDFRRDSLDRVLANKLFENLSPDECAALLVKLFLDAAQAHNDTACFELVPCLKRAYEAVVAGEKSLLVGRWLWESQDIFFREKLRGLYLQLPDRNHDGDGVPTEPVLVKTKLDMLSRIIEGWVPERTEESVVSFRFVAIAAYQPAGVKYLPSPGKQWTKAELQARGRHVSRGEKEGVKLLIRKRVGEEDGGHFEGGRFGGDTLSEWLIEPDLPMDIERILIVGRARNGGAKLGHRDIRYAKFLAPLKLEDRSAAALELHRECAAKIAELDTLGQKLLETMKPVNGYIGSEKIGESEYVLSDIEISYPSLGEITVRLTPPDNCSPELYADIRGRARRHLQAFQKEHVNVHVVFAFAGLPGVAV